LTDIGFYSAFKDIEIFYWTVNGTLDGLRDYPINQLLQQKYWMADCQTIAELPDL